MGFCINTQQGLWDKSKHRLKSIAFTKYGNKVDAIINTIVSGGYKGGLWGAIGGAYGARTGIVKARGIAITFK